MIVTLQGGLSEEVTIDRLIKCLPKYDWRRSISLNTYVSCVFVCVCRKNSIFDFPHLSSSFFLLRVMYTHVQIIQNANFILFTQRLYRKQRVVFYWFHKKVCNIRVAWFENIKLVLCPRLCRLYLTGLVKPFHTTVLIYTRLKTHEASSCRVFRYCQGLYSVSKSSGM